MLASFRGSTPASGRPPSIESFSSLSAAANSGLGMLAVADWFSPDAMTRAAVFTSEPLEGGRVGL